VIFLVVFPASTMAEDSTTSCFQRLHGSPHLFDVYFGVANDWHIYLQRTEEGEFGLSVKAKALLDGVPDEFRVTTLCNSDHVATWKPTNQGHIIARVFDNNLQALTPDFEVAENDDFQWEHSLASLPNGNFVVAYKVHTRRGKKVTGVMIRARIFSASGKPSGPPFNISSSSGFHNHPTVYGLPDGGFVGLWSPMTNPPAVYLRVFDGRGRPRTGEVLVMLDNRSCKMSGMPCNPEPFGYVTDRGVINVFMRCYSCGLEERGLLYAARSYNKEGVALTDTLYGKQMEALPGYAVISERFVREFASRLEFALRAFAQKDFLFGDSLCKQGASTIKEAVIMKGRTNNDALREYITRYCQKTLIGCGPVKYAEREHRQCAEVQQGEPGINGQQSQEGQ
jgi:hypothetical protein